MNSANASHADSPGAGLASWYTPGRSDGFGDRLLMFDNTDAISLELLRFRRELADTPGFEDALRDRVDRLSDFRHASFPLVRAAVHLDDHDLTLVSAHTPGQRLSELPTGKLRQGLHPAIVTWIVREVTPALAVLQSSGAGVAHGTLNADRIVLTSDARLCVVEHALGSAIGRLRLTPAALWRQFGLLAPANADGLVRVDAQTDVVQLGTIALGLLLARPVTLHDFERRLPALLDEFTALAAVSPSVFAAPLRAWLERALQLVPRSYRSAEDAREALHELPVPAAPPAAVGSVMFQLRGGSAAEPGQAGGSPEHRLTTVRAEARSPLRPAIVRERPPEPDTRAAHESSPDPHPLRTTPHQRWKGAYTVAVVVTLAILALGEGAIIARLGSQPTVLSVAAPLPPTGQQHPVLAMPIETAAVVPAVNALVAPPTATDRDAGAIALAAARQRSGGVRWSSPIELNVLEGDRVLGSTADGPIVITPGTHELELVNPSLGYRVRQTVNIRPGVITPVTLGVPMGRININAQPWAQVLIDNSPIGDTPLANVPVPLGQHQITFRHPQFGERRETVTVRGDTIARVSTTFDR